MGGDDRQDETEWRRGTFWLALSAAVVVFFGWMVWEFRWMSDDGFINVRVVENILAGSGPVFNAGERVEAYTSPLWVGVLSLLGALGAGIPSAAVGAGLCGSVLGLAAALFGSLVIRDGSTDWVGAAGRLWAVPAGAVTYAAVPVAWDYGTSGMENGLSMCWMGGTYALLAVHLVSDRTLADRDWRNYALAVLIGLGPLVRPELALFSVAFVAPVLVEAWGEFRAGRISAVRVAEFLAAAAALPVSYQIWRMGYFAALVPNTAVAKSAFDSRWEQGWHYTQNFFGFYVLALPLALLALDLLAQRVDLIDRDQLARATALAAPAVAGIAGALYVVKLGGGFMHGRLFLPALFGMLLPVSAIGLRSERRVERAMRFGLVLGVGAWAVLCAYSFRIPSENVHHIGDERNWYTDEAGRENPVTVEDYDQMHFTSDVEKSERIAKKHCPRAFREGDEAVGGNCDRIVFVDREAAGKLRPWSDTYPLRSRRRDAGMVMALLRTAIGLKSLVLDRHVHLVDRAGLASPIASRLTVEDRGRPGHEKQMGNGWFIGRFGEPGSLEPARVTAARRALRCGSLAVLDRAVTDDLTLSRFVRNVGLAFSLTGLEIPRNPFDAREKFCSEPRPVRRVDGGPGGNVGGWNCPVGYTLAGVEGKLAEKRRAFANVRPLCRPVDRREVPGASDLVQGPKFGGSSSAERSTARCDEGARVTGLSGAAEEYTYYLRLHCGTGPPGDETSDGATGTPGSELGEGSSEFTVRCPSGTHPGGMAVRSGALVDAVGFLCRPVPETSRPFSTENGADPE